MPSKEGESQDLGPVQVLASASEDTEAKAPQVAELNTGWD